MSTPNQTSTPSWTGPRGNGTLWFFLTFFLLSTIHYTHAEIYQQIDEKGQVIYTDKPNEDKEPYKIQDTNTIPATKPQPKPVIEVKQSTNSEELVVTRYKTVRIVEPPDDTAIHHGAGNVTVSVQTKPALGKKHSIQLTLDGKAHKKGRTGQFQLTNIDRGTHTLQAKIVDEKGKTVKSSSPVKVHLIRPTAY